MAQTEGEETKPKLSNMVGVADAISYRTAPVFHRGDVVRYGYGLATCPDCGEEVEVHGVVGEKRQWFHCHYFTYRML